MSTTFGQVVVVPTAEKDSIKIQLPKHGFFFWYFNVAKLAEKGPAKSTSKMQVAAFLKIKCDMSTIRTLKYHYN